MEYDRFTDGVRRENETWRQIQKAKDFINVASYEREGEVNTCSSKRT